MMIIGRINFGMRNRNSTIGHSNLRELNKSIKKVIFIILNVAN